MTEQAQTQKQQIIELMILSAVSLFCELLMIKWLTADFRSLAVFKSLPLAVCFVGLGAGIAVSKNLELSNKLFASFPFIFYLTIVIIRVLHLLGFSGLNLPSANLYQWTEVAKDLGSHLLEYQLFYMLFIAILMAGPLFTCMAIGARIGQLFNKLEPLPAYSADLSGALVGSIFFTVCAYMCLPIWVMAVIPPIVLVPFIKQKGWPLRRAQILVVLTIAAAAFPERAPEGTRNLWSPYARIDVYPIRAKISVASTTSTAASTSNAQTSNPAASTNTAKATSNAQTSSPAASTNTAMATSDAQTSSPAASTNTAMATSDAQTSRDPAASTNTAKATSNAQTSRDPVNTKQVGLLLNVNQIFHQFFFPEQHLPPEMVLAPEISERLEHRKKYYPMPYELKSGYQKVLILGAGVGQDVLEAVRHKVKKVDAVEIDPLVLKLGKEFNESYHLQNVNVICNDARFYVSRSKEKYDLVLLACLDSSALAGLGSSVRLDSYVHTLESARSIKKILSPDGIFMMTFGAGGGQWLQDRVSATIEKAFGYPPLLFQSDNVYFFVTGEPVRRGEIKVPKNAIATPNRPADRLLTDDWPFLYMAPPRMDWPFLLILLEAVMIALYSGRKLFFVPGYKPWSMFFMGAAFILVELAAIARLALIYSATWLTSAAVINAILLLNLAATILVMKLPAQKIRINLLFLLLLILLTLSYFSPNTSEFGPLANGAITMLMVLPCLASGLIFPFLYRQQPDAARALAFNIYGAVLGSMLEYCSNYFGLRSMIPLAVLLYLAAWWFSRMESSSHFGSDAGRESPPQAEPAN